jgi:hypothetical protein
MTKKPLALQKSRRLLLFLQAQIPFFFSLFDVLSGKNRGFLGCIAKKQTKKGYISGRYLE